MKPVELQLGGRSLGLVLNFGSLHAFERFSGKNALREWTWAALSASDMMFLVYATANRWKFESGVQVLNGPELVSLDDLAAHLLTLENLDSIREALGTLYDRAYPEESEGEEGRSASSGGDPLGSPGGSSRPSGDSISD
jgi:hypothetical protein